jgi:hypothetical protein
MFKKGMMKAAVSAPKGRLTKGKSVYVSQAVPTGTLLTVEAPSPSQVVGEGSAHTEVCQFRSIAGSGETHSGPATLAIPYMPPISPI